MPYRRLASLTALAVSLALLPVVTAAAAPGDPGPVAATLPADDLVLEQVYEAEDLLPPVSATSGLSARPSCCGIIRSNDQAITFGSGGSAKAGAAFTLALDLPQSGTWQLGVDYTVDPSFGIAQAAIDGQDIGAPFNSYNPTVQADRRVNYPARQLTAGRHELTFTITGKDARSSGLRIGMDLFRFRLLPDPGRLALSQTDGQLVSGQVPLVGYSTAADDTLDLRIDGQDVDDRAAVGRESASFVYAGGGSNGLQGGSLGFENRVELRGRAIPLASDVQDFAVDTVDVPGELLEPGQDVTVTLVAGTVPGECNADDFDVRDVALELPDGTVLIDRAMTGTYQLGDGTCGSNTSRRTRVDFTFAIPATTASGVELDPARGFVWDTTEVADGEHTVVLSSASTPAEQITRTLRVDNTTPTFTRSSPLDGDRLKGEFTIDAAATDAGSEVESLTATLDGESVELPSTRSTDDLSDGEHVVVFTAVDGAGNTATRTATVTTVRQRPDAPALVAPADGATGQPTDPELRVTATDPAGDPLTVTFLEATSSPPRAGASTTGDSATAPPVTLSPDIESALTGEQVQAASVSDDSYAEAPITDGFPFQRYDLQLDGRQTDLELSWEGRIDATREIALSAFDPELEEWVELTRGRGLAGEDLTLQAPVDPARFADGDVVHVLVQALDPFADDIVDPANEEFRDPDSFDFSLAWLTDTQYLSEGAVDPDEANTEKFAAAYRDINEWIVDNAVERKIAYTAHTGDLINNWISDNNTPEYRARAEREFQFASDTMDLLEIAGIPYGVTPGNHDNKTGATADLYNEYFPPSRYEEASETAAQDYYGGSWRPGDNQNHFDLFSAGGQDFIVVYLGYVAGEEEIDWANGVLADHRDRKAIFATHEYLRPSRNADGRDGALSDENVRSQGVELFEELVLPNENVFLAISGHTHGVALNVRRDVGDQGRTVVEMLANYQFYEVDNERRTGFFRLLQVDVDASEISVNTYSPTLKNHNADEFDTANNRDYVPAADEYTVPVDLDSRTTTFGTDAVRLDALTDAVIGTDDVDSGEQAAVTWTGRAPDTSYAWYARTDDDEGGTGVSRVFTFSTGDGGPGDGGGPAPVIPEIPFAVLLPLSALALAGYGGLRARRRAAA